MTEEQISPESEFNLDLINPNALEEPKETFPVIVRVSNLRWSDPKYNAATSFRQAFPHTGKGPEGNSIQQWDLQLERLDAVYYHEDGSPFPQEDGTAPSTVPVRVYAGIDLQKMDKNGVVKGIMKTRGKEPFVLNAWTNKTGSLLPSPQVLVGKILLVDRYREKEIAAGFFAKNVTVPVEVLSPTYTYTGPVQRFKAGRDASEEAGGGVSAGPTATGVSKDEAATLIAGYLVSKGYDREKVSVSILSEGDFPQAARIEPFLTAIALGDLASTLTGFGV